MTRLRLKVADTTLIAHHVKEQLSESISGVVINGNEVQVIFGVGKAQRAADSMNNLLDKKDLHAIADENKSQLKSQAAIIFATIPGKLCHYLYSPDSGLYRVRFDARYRHVVRDVNAYCARS